MQLAKIYVAQDDLKKAIAYYQRIYTLYPGYSDLVVTAYYESALMFVALDDMKAAYRTLEEMLNTSKVTEHFEYPKALALKTQLESTLYEKSQSEFRDQK